MKRFLLFTFLLLFGCLSGNIQAQDGQCLTTGGCAPGGTQFPSADQSTTSSTFVTVSTLIYAGEWQRYEVTSGTVYEWSLCIADGGNASYDSQLTLYNDSNALLCYSDDLCGDDAKIRWTATYTGFARTRVNQFNCGTNSTNTTLVWRQVSTVVPNPTCGTTFYDSGGAGGNYTNNENRTYNICPSISGEVVTVNFTSVFL